MSRIASTISLVSVVVIGAVMWPNASMGAPTLGPTAYLPYVGKKVPIVAPYVQPNYSTYTDAQGREHIVGEVFNPNNAPLSQIYISVAGESPALTYPYIQSVQAHQAGCFNTPLGASGLNLRPEVTSYSEDGWALPPLSISSNSAYDPASKSYTVSGQVANIVGGTRKSAVLVATAYDSSERVIGCIFDLIQLDAQNPVGFSLIFSDHDYASVSRYVLQAGSFS